MKEQTLAFFFVIIGGMVFQAVSAAPLSAESNLAAAQEDVDRCYREVREYNKKLYEDYLAGKPVQKDPRCPPCSLSATPVTTQPQLATITPTPAPVSTPSTPLPGGGVQGEEVKKKIIDVKYLIVRVEMINGKRWLIFRLPDGTQVQQMEIKDCLIPNISEEENKKGVKWELRDDNQGAPLGVKYDPNTNTFFVMGTDGVERSYRIELSGPHSISRQKRIWELYSIFGTGNDEDLKSSFTPITFTLDPNCPNPLAEDYDLEMREGERLKNFELSAIVPPKWEKDPEKQLTYSIVSIKVLGEAVEEELRKSIKLTPDGKLSVQLPKGLDLKGPIEIEYEVETTDGTGRAEGRVTITVPSSKNE